MENLPDDYTKTCSVCKEEQHKSCFYKHKRSKDRLSYECKSCVSKQRSKFWEENKEVLKPKKKAHYDANQEAILEQKREYGQREETKKRRRDRYANDPEYKSRIQKTHKESYYRRRDTILEQKRGYYQENKDVIQANHSQWRKDNPEQDKAYSDKRRMRKAAVPYEPTNRQELYKRDEGICYLCGKYVPYDKFHEEHIIPISRTELNPTHSYSNLGVACQPCNNRKRNRTPEECEWAINLLPKALLPKDAIE